MYLVILLSMLLGISVGSLLNVIVRRNFRNEQITGRSHCESCKRILSPKELIPVFSFLVQKGRCRSCGSALSFQYPAVELSTGILFAAAAWYLFPTEDLIFYELSYEALAALGYLLLVLLGISAAIVIFVSDILYRIIPNGAFIVLFTLGIVSKSFLYSSGLLTPVDLAKDLGIAILFSLLLASFWFFSKGRWMGLGDAKLILATSLLLGYSQAISAFLFSFWLGGLTGIFLLIFRLKSLKDLIPFGPFILIGSVLAYFFSDFFLLYTNLYPLL